MKKNFIKKVVIGGLITSLCICCCFVKVNASVIDDNASYFDDYFYFEPKQYSSINSYEDLKGTIWHLNFDFYKEKEGYDEFNIALRFIQNNDENHLYDLPFIIQLRNDFIKTEIGYNLFPDANISICPLYNSNNGSAIILNGNQGGVTGYLNFYSYYEREFNGKINIGVNKDEIYQSKFLFYDNDYSQTYQDIAILSEDNENNNKYGSSELYLFFPKGNYVIEDYSNVKKNFLSMLKEASTSITLSDATERRIFTSYQDGYTDGYSIGFDVGSSTGNNTYRFTFLTGIFNAVSDVLNLEIFPNIKLSYFIFVPLVLGITGMIFWFWRKD